MWDIHYTLTIFFREIRKRNNISICINNSLCTTLYNTIRTYL